MLRTDAIVASSLIVLGTLLFTSACSSSSDADGDTTTAKAETNPTCLNGVSDGDETGIDCGGSCVAGCNAQGLPDNSPINGAPPGSNGKQDGTETDVDCGGGGAKCGEGKNCKADADCDVACGYAGKCVGAPSCATHLGGDTCGQGEVGQDGTVHESCCRTLPVTGYTDAAHAGKTVYLDKYEITVGRVRAWIEKLAAENAGNPDVKGWIAANRPQVWDDAWNDFLPTGFEGPTKLIGRRLLGDVRIEDGTGSNGPGVILPPATDQVKNLGVNYQFNSEVYVDLHGTQCGAFKDSYGYSTYWYPADILARDNQLPRPDGKDYAGRMIPSKDLLDVKSMNCITNAMLAAFCAWDGGQLATDEVLDYVTETPATLGNVSGCGTQYDNHGDLLGNNFSRTVQTGGRCADVIKINATFDGGDALPVAGSPLNNHAYRYPDLLGSTSDKTWEIASPGRGTLQSTTAVDAIRLKAGDEPWMDLGGNLNEAALDTTGATFSGLFSLKYRGIAYGTARSDLNFKQQRGEDRLRIQRPEAKAAYTGGRCMRFR